MSKTAQDIKLYKVASLFFSFVSVLFVCLIDDVFVSSFCFACICKFILFVCLIVLLVLSSRSQSIIPMSMFQVRRVMDGGNVTTKFELGMTLYRDESYSVSFGIGDFPLRVTVNRPLFVQVKIDSPDSRLRVMADRCYATPTQDPRHPMQYDIINDG